MKTNLNEAKTGLPCLCPLVSKEETSVSKAVILTPLYSTKIEVEKNPSVLITTGCHLGYHVILANLVHPFPKSALLLNGRK